MRATVGIPFRNAAAWLPMAIRSVFAQSTGDWDLLLVDDGSSDGSVEIARSVCDARVQVVVDGRHRGLAWRLNEIAALATAPLIARMDADDIMFPDRLARQVEAFAGDPLLEVCSGLAIAIDERHRPIGWRGGTNPSRRALNVFARAPFVHPTVMFSREWAQRHPYSQQYPRAEDHHLWCAHVDAMRFRVVAAPLVLYRETDANRVGPYLATNRSVRGVIRDLGTGRLSRVQRVALLTRTHVADAVRRVTSGSGADRWLQAWRRSSQPAAVARRCDALVATVAATAVPGLDHAR